MTQEIGTEVIESTSRPGPVVVAAAAAALLVGAGLGATWSALRAQPAEPAPADGGAVFVCGSHALATLHVHGLDREPVEVMLPLRGDGVLLPVTKGDVDVLVGSIAGHQRFRPSDGHLALTQQVGVPVEDTVAARVGARALALPVTRCSTR